jgi:hypothetical protein
MMTDDELIDAIRKRIVDPRKRIDVTTVDTPPLCGAASARALDEAEARVGFPLPALVRRIYAEVGNGGFGPSAGLVGVDGGHADVDGRHLSALYAELRAQGLPERVLPLADWGGGAWACIDEVGRVVTMDEAGATMTRFTLASWLEAWVSGVDLLAETFEFNDGIMTNPFTKKPMAVKHRGRAKGISAR